MFTRTKHGADGSRATSTVRASRPVHPRRQSQNQRQRALADFKKCKIAVLVATVLPRAHRHQRPAARYQL
ncbi:MAG: hypothetical protein ACLRVN_03860 [Butyricicoccus sp.]